MGILDLAVHASVLGDISNETVANVDSPTRGLVNFTMNTREQAHHFGSQGFYGTVGVQYKLNKSSADMDIVTQEKHVILVLENDSKEFLKNVSEEVIGLSEQFIGNSSFSFVYIEDDNIFLWASTQSEEYFERVESFLRKLLDPSSSKPLPVGVKDLQERLFTNQNSLDKTHLLHLKSSSNTEKLLNKYFDSEMLSTISVRPIEDLAQINRINVEYKGDIVDQRSLTKT